MIKNENTMENNRTPGTIENDVLFGHDGYLFLANGGHHVLDYCTGRLAVSENSIENFVSNIANRALNAEALGAKYIHIIAPDKQSVLTDEFPVKQVAKMGSLFLEYANNVAQYILYPVNILQESEHQTYQKTDTHMTDAGSIIVTEEIINALYGNEFIKRDKIDLKLTEEQYWVGDLGGKLIPKLSENRINFKFPSENIWFNNNIIGGNNGIVDIRFNKLIDMSRRILIFGDSFGRELARFLSFYYFETVFMRTPYFHHEIVSQICPNTVITQCVERYLPSTKSDIYRPNFFMYPHLNNLDYRPSLDFASAMSAIMSFGRPIYDSFIEELCNKKQ